jgi:hypothetical protein
LLLLALASGMAAAQEKPSDHPYTAPVVLDGKASHYRLIFPPGVYRGAARRDLGDLRVFNAAGEPVPYAFAPRESQPAAPALRDLNLFPLHADRERNVDSANVRIERTPNGTVVNVSVAGRVPAARRKLVGYIVDASELKAPEEALVLTWEAGAGFSGQARVDGSDDLKSWQPLAANAPILLLEHAGARLERNRVELAGARMKYLRLSFRGVPPGFRLKGVQVELRSATPEPAREWLAFPAERGKGSGELLVDTQGHFPVDRVRFGLPQPNTVAQVRLFTRDRAEDPWRAAASGTAYRLVRDGGELTNPDIRLAVHSERYWRIEVDQKGGGFGAGDVRFEIGWLPHELVFAARGAGSFTVAYGNKVAKAGALPISMVVPGDEKEIAAAKSARLGDVSALAPSSPSFFSDPALFLRGFSENHEAKKWTLWAALVAGVLLLGWMAFRLLHDMGKGAGGGKTS